MTDIDVRFQVPLEAKPGVQAELARRATQIEHRSLVAIYLDTPDRRLARAGMSWRLRREGRRWIQTLKAGGPNALERFEHEVIRTAAVHDATAHAGTAAGDRLIEILADASAEGLEVDVRFRAEIRRTARRVRTRGAVVEVVFDEGRLLAAGSSQRIREMEFALLSGSASAMLTLAERWRKRFGLILDPRSKSARGDRLADGSQFPAVRKASLPDYPRRADAAAAWRAVLDECLAQISLNAIGIAAGDPKLVDDHVHQLRVGIRRLRSALRSFGGWVGPPPTPLVDELRKLFATLGASRDSTVLDSGVVLELARVGAPTLMTPPKVNAPDPVEAVRSTATQRLLLAWITWRETLQEKASSEADTVQHQVDEALPIGPAEAVEQAASDVVEALDEPLAYQADAPIDAEAFHRLVERRLRQWHRRIAHEAKIFDELEEEALHELRKRIKRQRYTVEFFAPVMKRRSVARYLDSLAVIQDRMGGLNDLFVARERFQELIASDPAAWFALGWLAARIAETRASARPELLTFAKTELPTIA